MKYLQAQLILCNRSFRDFHALELTSVELDLLNFDWQHIYGVILNEHANEKKLGTEKSGLKIRNISKKHKIENDLLELETELRLQGSMVYQRESNQIYNNMTIKSYN